MKECNKKEREVPSLNYTLTFLKVCDKGVISFAKLITTLTLTLCRKTLYEYLFRVGSQWFLKQGKLALF